MAKQKGFIKLKGSLGGLTFYKSGGEDIVKTVSGVSKERILNDPNFKRTRENMLEFGASAKIGKAFRMGFSSIVKTMGDSTLAGRVTGMMKRINSVGVGNRGKRSFEVLKNKHFIEGFEFDKRLPFGSVFYAPFGVPTLDANRSVVTWTVPDFNTDNYINVPEGASHFRLVLNVAVLSDYVYNNSVKNYEFVNEAENGVNGVSFSTEIPLGGLVGSATVLTVDLGFGAALPTTVGVLVGVGIVFYQEVNAGFYELASDNVMQVVIVG